MSDAETISVNRRAAELTAALSRDAAILNVGVARGPLGETLIDAGAKQRGGIEAGLRIAEICLGGLGAVRLAPDNATPRWPWTIAVSFRRSRSSPASGSQYAGWSLSHGTGKDAFFALGSGPGSRAGAKGGGVQGHRLSGRSRCRDARHRKRTPAAARDRRESRRAIAGSSLRP